MPAHERFWAKVNKTGDCWNWTAYRAPDGYGKFSYNGRIRLAYGVAYELEVGPIPHGMMLDHRCHNRACVRPEHLRPVTTKQNQENRSGAQVNNKSSGVRGVTWNKQVGKWAATVRHNRAPHYLGLFADVASAEAAVVAKRRELFTHSDMDA